VVERARTMRKNRGTQKQLVQAAMEVSWRLVKIIRFSVFLVDFSTLSASKAKSRQEFDTKDKQTSSGHLI